MQQIVLAQAVVERRAIDAERPRRAGDVAFVALDGGNDLVALLLLQARVQLRTNVGGACCCSGDLASGGVLLWQLTRATISSIIMVLFI